MTSPQSIFMVLPVPFKAEGEDLFFESQAANGAALWADNFQSVSIAAPVAASSDDSRAMSWVAAKDTRNNDRIKLIPLPNAPGAGAFFLNYATTRRVLAKAIRENQYLSFALWSLFGDWASVAALEAQKQGRAYSVWTDIVNHTAHLSGTDRKNWAAKAKAKIVARLMKNYHRQIIQKSALGLFHGADCFDAYAPWCENSHLVHDIHLTKADQISGGELSLKIERARRGEPLRIIYVGRISAEKGPEDWIAALKRAQQLGVSFKATWFGGGPQLEAATAAAASAGLSARVKFPGFVSDREKIVGALRDADILLFCHKTEESPRCLIEALKSGSPIIGYSSGYPRDLTEDGGGRFVNVGESHALGDLIAELAGPDRTVLADLMTAAAVAGSELDDVGVFKHRSELITEHS